MKSFAQRIVLLVPLLVATLDSSAGSLMGQAPASEVAQALMERYRSAQVQVEATLEMKLEMLEGPAELATAIASQPAREQTTQAEGVVVHAAGIVAVPIVPLDPTQLTQTGIAMGPAKVALRGKIQAIKVVDAEGEEHEASVALTDPQRGILLVKLLQPPTTPWSAIEFVEPAPQPAPFASMIMLQRLPAELGFEPMVSTVRFVQQLSGPVAYYDMTGNVNGLGFTVYDLQQQFQGIGVVPIRAAANTSTSVLILPSQEILPLVRKVQAASE